MPAASQNVIKVYFEGADLANLSESFLGTLLFFGTYKVSIWCKTKQRPRCSASRVTKPGHM